MPIRINCRGSLLASDQRVEWIDIAKGIGILLVLIGHVCDKHTLLWNFITLFHMPLFFTISGYVLKLDKPIKLFLKSKLMTLWVPYVSLSLLVYWGGILFGDEIFSIVILIKILLMLYTPGIIGAAWFICCLFYAEIILKILFDFSTHLSKYFNALLVYVVCIILCTVLSCISYRISFPLGISRVLIGTSFLLLGKIVSSIGTRKMIVQPKLRTVVIGFLLFAGLLVLSKNNYSSYSSNTFSNIFISIISAIAGSTLVFIVANIIQSRNNFVKRTMLFLGKKRLELFIFSL